jgi:hypothetical protein
MAGFGVSGVKPSGYDTRELVMQILGKYVVRKPAGSNRVRNLSIAGFGISGVKTLSFVT